MILLKRVDVERHMDRWYLVAASRDLFGPALICGWGNRRTLFQHLRATSTSDERQAKVLAGKITARQLRRGYTIVEDQAADSRANSAINISIGVIQSDQLTND